MGLRVLAAWALLALTGSGVDLVKADDTKVKLKVQTFNLRTSSASGDAGSTCSNWSGVRRDNVISQIKAIEADFIGTQETQEDQKAYLDAQLSGYTSIGSYTGSYNGQAGEYDAIWYKNTDWTMLTNGMFWLGPDPDTASADWGMTYYRTCVWGRFQHIPSGLTVCVLNTHYETPGNNEAQEHGSSIIMQRVLTVCDASDRFRVLTGDFNAERTYPAIQMLIEAGWQDTSDEPTWCADMISTTCSSIKYDFVFHSTNDSSSEVCLVNEQVYRTSYDGCYPSDHATLVSTYCITGNCCDDDSSSGSSSVGSSSGSTTIDVQGEGVMAGATSTTISKGSSGSSSDAQSATTQSSGGSNTSVTVVAILGILCAVGVVCAVVIKKRNALEDKTKEVKSSLVPVPSYFTSDGNNGNDEADAAALSPLTHGANSGDFEGSGDFRDSGRSPIPTLMDDPNRQRNSRSSSVSVAGIENNHSVDDNNYSIDDSMRSASERSRSPSSPVMMSESDFSIASYESSLHESRIHFSEAHTPGDSIAKSNGFALL